MNHYLKLFVISIIILFFDFEFAMPQGEIGEGEILDKIVAIVGEEIIMQSDIEGKLAILKQENPGLNINDANIRKNVVDALINEYLIITKAIEDSVVVTEDEINEKWDKLKIDLVQAYGSYQRIEDVYGKSISRIQYEYRDMIRKYLLGYKLQEKKFGNIKITPHEVEEFYFEKKDSLPKVPKQLELYHIVKYTSASQKAKDEIYELAKRVRDSIIIGGLFSDFAKRYSQDPGSASNGGELGWFGKGKLLLEFEKAAFDLVPGQTSMPVETPFGFHIIQTLDKTKDSVMTRHILFRIGQSEDDKKLVLDYLRSFKDSLEDGKDFESLAKKYSEETSSKGFGGALGILTQEQLPLSFKEQILAVKTGSITEPLPYNIDPAKPAFHIIFKKKEIPEHFPDLKEDFKILEQKALVFKKMKLYDEWINQLRKELYWEIKEN